MGRRKGACVRFLELTLRRLCNELFDAFAVLFGGRNTGNLRRMMVFVLFEDFELFGFLVVVDFGKLDVLFELFDVSFGGVFGFVFDVKMVFAVAGKYFGVDESKVLVFVLFEGSKYHIFFVHFLEVPLCLWVHLTFAIKYYL